MGTIDIENAGRRNEMSRFEKLSAGIEMTAVVVVTVSFAADVIALEGLQSIKDKVFPTDVNHGDGVYIPTESGTGYVVGGDKVQ